MRAELPHATADCKQIPLYNIMTVTALLGLRTFRAFAYYIESLPVSTTPDTYIKTGIIIAYSVTAARSYKSLYTER